MGGHKFGDKASKLAVEYSTYNFLQNIKNNIPTGPALEQALNTAAAAVYEEQRSDARLTGMGTTLSCLALCDNSAFISHIGDTRIYCIRDKAIHQLTSDHSLVNEQVQAGIMSAEEARVSSLRNIITRAIGHNKEVRADHFSLNIKDKDLFLLCSDGLNTMLHDHEIVYIINNQTFENAVNDLIDAANLKGGEDNISVVLVETRL
jgi:protein phosphatase